MKRLDEEGPDALVAPPVPVNRYPDFVAVAAQKLRLAGAALGRKRIANMLARAGLHLGRPPYGACSAETVARPPKPPVRRDATPRRSQPARRRESPSVTAKAPIISGISI